MIVIKFPCESKHISFNSCNDCYCPKLTGEVCCPDEQHNRVSTGIGDSCCGRMPYSTSGNQICCAGRLRDGHGQQCCGGQIVNKDLECCGGEEEGMVYSRLPGKEPLSTFQSVEILRNTGREIALDTRQISN